jgi:hypothetical protein
MAVAVGRAATQQPVAVQVAAAVLDCLALGVRVE